MRRNRGYKFHVGKREGSKFQGNYVASIAIGKTRKDSSGPRVSQGISFQGMECVKVSRSSSMWQKQETRRYNIHVGKQGVQVSGYLASSSIGKTRGYFQDPGYLRVSRFRAYGISGYLALGPRVSQGISFQGKGVYIPHPLPPLIPNEYLYASS